ncbi:CAP-Gly domain-containing linker protein 1-like isoform X1 [Clytia hemisphaerica]|uniref:CAP-Gly domain-containing protein n=1 Tax=Clytia hemisphaerica TaxID=252671 RepID=A0A7M5UMQ4_9CNID
MMSENKTKQTQSLKVRRSPSPNVGSRQDSNTSSSRQQKSAINRQTKKQQSNPLKIGDVVTFIYNSKRVHGIAQFIGQTDFSTNILCGVALVEEAGKHNGTVKGRQYFQCIDNHGVFVPLRKVTLVPSTLRDKIKKRLNSLSSGEEEKESEEEQDCDDEMRITVKSYKAPQNVSSKGDMTSQRKPIVSRTIDDSSSLSISKDRGTISSNSSCDSGIESPTRLVANERLAARRANSPAAKKNIVVSSFITESPQKPVLFNSFDEDTPPTSLESSISKEKNIILNEAANLVKDSATDSLDLDQEVFVEEMKHQLHSEPIIDNMEVKSDTPNISSSRIQTNDINTGHKEDAKFLKNDSHDIKPSTPIDQIDPPSIDCEDGNSKIPRPLVSAAAKVFEKLEQEEKIPSKQPIPNKRSSSIATIGKLRKNSAALKNRTTSNLTSTNRSSLRKGSATSTPSTNSNNTKTVSSNNTKTSSTTGNSIIKPSSIDKTSSYKTSQAVLKTPSSSTVNTNKASIATNNYKATSVSLRTSSLTSSSSTPAPPKSQIAPKSQVSLRSVGKQTSSSSVSIRKGSVRSKFDATKRRASKDDDPSIVMGNSNATVHPSTTKNNEQNNGAELYSQREISGAVVIERASKKSKTKQNGIISTDKQKLNELQKFSELQKQAEQRQKELEQQVDNLNNQLKERTNRINELESTLYNNNNNIEEEKNEFNKLSTDLKNEVALKNQEIQLQEEKLRIAKRLVEKSNSGIEALTLVVQYHLKQLESQNAALLRSKDEATSEQELNARLSNENTGLSQDLEDLKINLENETCRCESLQKDYESLRLNHEAEISRLHEEHILEKNNTLVQTQKDYDLKLQEAWDKQTRLTEEHQNELKKLKDEHRKTLEKLREENKEKEGRLSVEPPPRLQSPGGTPLYTDRYDNMPEELKSLNIVLDMKNEELKNLRTRNMELERKLDKHYELETKYDALAQKNQSMAEMLKQKSLTERQLSVERENLMEKFETESKKVSQLSMEKEQLIWRASNPDLTYGSLARIDDEDDDEARDSPPSPLRSSGSFSASSTPRRLKTSKEAEIAKKLKRRSMNF